MVKLITDRTWWVVRLEGRPASRRAGDYVDKILRGAKPGDIPVEQPTKFDLVINLTTAKAIGLTIPESFLQRANELSSTRRRADV